MQQQITSAIAPGERIATRRDPVLELVHRATFGYTTEEHARACSMGFEAWRDEQLAPASIDDSALDGVIATSFPSVAMNLAELLVHYLQAGVDDFEVARELRGARFFRAVWSKRQLFERVVEFWTVSSGKSDFPIGAVTRFIQAAGRALLKRARSRPCMPFQHVRRNEASAVTDPEGY